MQDQRLKIKTENRRMEQVDDCQVSVYIPNTFNRICIYKQIDRRWPPSEILVARLYFPSVSPLSNVCRFYTLVWPPLTSLGSTPYRNSIEISSSSRPLSLQFLICFRSEFAPTPGEKFFSKGRSRGKSNSVQPPCLSGYSSRVNRYTALSRRPDGAPTTRHSLVLNTFSSNFPFQFFITGKHNSLSLNHLYSHTHSRCQLTVIDVALTVLSPLSCCSSVIR